MRVGVGVEVVLFRQASRSDDVCPPSFVIPAWHALSGVHHRSRNLGQDGVGCTITIYHTYVKEKSNVKLA